MRAAVDRSRAALLGAVRERDFQDEVIGRAKTLGWLVFHARKAGAAKGWATHIQGDVGFPDLVLCRRPRVLFLELKTTSGRVTEGQRRWLNELEQVTGIEVRVVTPSDWSVIDWMLA